MGPIIWAGYGSSCPQTPLLTTPQKKLRCPPSSLATLSVTKAPVTTNVRPYRSRVYIQPPPQLSHVYKSRERIPSNERVRATWQTNGRVRDTWTAATLASGTPLLLELASPDMVQEAKITVSLVVDGFGAFTTALLQVGASTLVYSHLRVCQRVFTRLRASRPVRHSRCSTTGGNHKHGCLPHPSFESLKSSKYPSVRAHVCVCE